MNDKNNHAETKKSPPAGGDLGAFISPSRGQEGNMFYGAPQILFDFAKQLRNRPTDAEDFLWKQLSKKNW
jgi:hypothetical protein